MAEVLELVVAVVVASGVASVGEDVAGLEEGNVVASAAVQVVASAEALVEALAGAMVEALAGAMVVALAVASVVELVEETVVAKTAAVKVELVLVLVEA